MWIRAAESSKSYDRRAWQAISEILNINAYS